MTLALEENSGFAAVYVDSGRSQCTPEKKRITMIAKEMDEMLEETRDYLLRHMIANDVGDEMRDALYKAALDKCYHSHYYDVMENKVVYYPTCYELILNNELIVEAEKHYYMSKDKFPPEYSRALKCVARATETKRKLEEKWKSSHHKYESDEESEVVVDAFKDDQSASSVEKRIDCELMDKLAESWRTDGSSDSLFSLGVAEARKERHERRRRPPSIIEQQPQEEEQPEEEQQPPPRPKDTPRILRRNSVVIIEKEREALLSQRDSLIGLREKKDKEKKEKQRKEKESPRANRNRSWGILKNSSMEFKKRKDASSNKVNRNKSWAVHTTQQRPTERPLRRRDSLKGNKNASWGSPKKDRAKLSMSPELMGMLMTPKKTKKSPFARRKKLVTTAEGMKKTPSLGGGMKGSFASLKKLLIVK